MSSCSSFTTFCITINIYYFYKPALWAVRNLLSQVKFHLHNLVDSNVWDTLELSFVIHGPLKKKTDKNWFTEYVLCTDKVKCEHGKNNKTMSNCESCDTSAILNSLRQIFFCNALKTTCTYLLHSALFIEVRDLNKGIKFFFTRGTKSDGNFCAMLESDVRYSWANGNSV